jgi:hypothetical protein
MRKYDYATGAAVAGSLLIALPVLELVSSARRVGKEGL